MGAYPPPKNQVVGYPCTKRAVFDANACGVHIMRYLFEMETGMIGIIFEKPITGARLCARTSLGNARNSLRN